MGRVIAIANQKGGVGKTTTAVAMGAALSERGYKVLLVDVDDSGNPSLTKGLSQEDHIDKTLTDLMLYRILQRDITAELPEAIYHHSEGMDFIPADNQLPGISNALSTVKDDKAKQLILKDIVDAAKVNYDFVILDAAPSLNIVSINVLAAADEIVITTQPQGAAEEGLIELLQTAAEIKQKVNTRLIVKGLLITMVDIRTKYNKDKAQEMTNNYTELGMKVFTTYIPRAVAAEKWVDHKASLLKYDPAGKPAMAYRKFVAEYLGEL